MGNRRRKKRENQADQITSEHNSKNKIGTTGEQVELSNNVRHFLYLPLPSVSLCEYIWLDNDDNFVSKSQVVRREFLNSLPEMKHDTPYLSENLDYLYILASYQDPFRVGNNFLFFCCIPPTSGSWFVKGVPNSCQKLSEKGELYNFYQKFSFINSNGVKILDQSFGRSLLDATWRAFIFAGLAVTGVKKEQINGQWAYFCQPLKELPTGFAKPPNDKELGYMFWISRYILERIAEMTDVRIEYYDSNS